MKIALINTQSLRLLKSLYFLVATVGAVIAQASPSEAQRGTTYDYRDIGEHCIPVGCRNFNLPGRIAVVRGGKAVFYFPNSRGGYMSQGFVSSPNQTVSVPRSGITPKNFRMGDLMDVRRDANFEIVNYMKNMSLRSGEVTNRSSGDQINVVLNLYFQGPVANGSSIIGRGDAHWVINYTYNFDRDTRSMRDGTGNIQVQFNLALDGANPSTVQYTSTSRLVPAQQSASYGR